jgi:predicted nucleic acid-binding protein
MALIADSGGILGLYNAKDEFHPGIREVIERERDRIVIPSPLLGEIDYLLRSRLGAGALIAFVDDVASGAFWIEPFTGEDLARCRALLTKYADLDLGLADASVIAIAERLGTDRILTVDERDFRAVRSARGTSFVLLPADEAAPRALKARGGRRK